MGPIPWDVMVEYAEHTELDEYMTQVFVTVMRYMDKEYLQWESDEQKKISEQKAPKVKKR